MFESASKPFTLSSAAFVALVLAGCDPGAFENESRGGGDPDDVVDVETETKALNNGWYTTSLFIPVVRIQNSSGSLCTATAIDHDTLITASHCIKSGNTVTDYVKIVEADGANSGADNNYSSYFILSEDIYENYYVAATNDYTYYRRDFTLVKFGRNTFSEYYDFQYKTNVALDETLYMVGFGGSTDKAWGYTSVEDSYQATNSSGYGYIDTTSYSDFGQGDTESGDSGGPLLYKDTNGDYFVIGVLYGNGFYSSITPAVFNHLSTYLTQKEPYCVEGFEHSNYGGERWSFCFDGTINNALASQGFYEPFQMYRATNYSDWNDEISSLYVPDNISVTFFQHYNFSTSQGYGNTVTFVNAFDFLDNTNIASLSDYGFNDVLSSWSMVYDSTPDFSLQVATSGKCVDVRNASTGNYAPIQQYSCSDNNPAQEFELLSTSTANVYQIRNKNSLRCLNVTGGVNQNGTPIQQYNCNSSNTHNLFRLESVGSLSRFRMVNIHTGRCVDLSNGSSSNEAIFWLWECSSSNTNQHFSFKRYW